MSGSRLLTIDEVQERLAVGRTTVFVLMNEGQLPSVKIGRSRRIVESDVDAYIESLRAT